MADRSKHTNNMIRWDSPKMGNSGVFPQFSDKTMFWKMFGMKDWDEGRMHAAYL